MNGRQRQRIATGQSASRVVASMLVAAFLFMLDPAPAPATENVDVTPTATRTAERQQTPFAEPECTPATPEVLEPTTEIAPDPDSVSPTPEATEAADPDATETAVPLEDPTAVATETPDIAGDVIEECRETGLGDADPAATVTPAADTGSTPSPVDASRGGSGVEASPGATLPPSDAEQTPEIAVTPSASPTPMLDLLEGIEQPAGDVTQEDDANSENAPPVDPFLIAPPDSDVTPAGDPMLVGLDSLYAPADPFVDPLLVGLPAGSTPSPAAGPTADVVSVAAAINAKKPKAGVTVDAISADGTVAPGGQVSYLFRVVNTAKNTEHFWIEAETTGTGWTTVVYSENGSIVLTDRQTLKGGQEMRILVVVTAPPYALAGDVVTTTVNAVD